MSTLSAARGWRWTILAGCVLLAAVALATTVPVWREVLPACYFHTVTGWHCPGCGGTRGTIALLAGDFWRALRMNPLLVASIAAAAVAGLRAVWRERRGLKPALPEISNRTGWGIGIAVVGISVLRNLPWWPFTLLAPP